MKKLVVAGFSLVAVVLLVLGSQANVVGYQTQQNTKDVVLQVEVTGSSLKKTVNLTEDEYHHLMLYLQDFQTRLNASTSLVESKSLFKEALGRLKSFGLLPGINKERLYSQMCRILPKNNACHKNMFSTGPTNLLCLVYGKATYVYYQNLLIDLLCFNIVFQMVSYITTPLFTITPFAKGQVVSFGGDVGIFDDITYYDSNGYISTSGLNGVASYNGSFYGDLRLPDFCNIYPQHCYPALAGFFGIKLSRFKNGESIFLGSAVVANYVT